MRVWALKFYILQHEYMNTTFKMESELYEELKSNHYFHTHLPNLSIRVDTKVTALTFTCMLALATLSSSASTCSNIIKSTRRATSGNQSEYVSFKGAPPGKAEILWSISVIARSVADLFPLATQSCTPNLFFKTQYGSHRIVRQTF